MTLHWWMHWFWVTAQIVVTLTIPVPTTTSQPISAEMTTTSLPIPTTTSTSSTTMSSPLRHNQSSLTDQTTAETLAKIQQSSRIAKAIGLQPFENERENNRRSESSLRLLVTTDSPGGYGRQIHQMIDDAPSLDGFGSNRTTETRTTATSTTTTAMTQAGRIPGKKEPKLHQDFIKPPRSKNNKTLIVTTTMPSTSTSEESLTVMPLREINNDPNAIRRDQPIVDRSSLTFAGGIRDEIEDASAVIATAASVVDANSAVLSIDSTRLGRARGTFVNEFQHEQRTLDEQQRNEDDDDDDRNQQRHRHQNSEQSSNVTEIAAITGSCLAVVVLLSTIGSVGFIMYRRRYLNPPQTLNSDKCSNPDSSGYIDDSTMRDNSEEMYSLDNDSFLNSLEAMTIQNYWTDSVKHTKL